MLTKVLNQMNHDANLAKSALEIAQQPPETWYKDQFGRRATFELQVNRTELFCPQCVDQRILRVRLLYESGKVVEKQEILHVMAGQCLDNNRKSTLAVRITQVSKNHLNQRFRVEIAVPVCPGECNYNPSVVSRPVLVLSKKKKKRSVKENTETESPFRLKKVKHSFEPETPSRKLSRDATVPSSPATATIAGNVTAVIAEMEKTIPPRASETIAPFTPETPDICLWANAAFDLLYNLQWQRVHANIIDKSKAKLDEILSHAFSNVYKCPSCQETYGQIPTHRDDCDLKLLLEQGEPTEAPASRRASHDTTYQSLQWSTDKNFERPDQPIVVSSGGEFALKSPYSFAESLLQMSSPGIKQEPTNGFDSTAVATNLNIGSWKDYASLSKLLYSSTVYLESKSPQQAGTASRLARHWSGVLPPVGILPPGCSSLHSSTNGSEIQQAKIQQQRVESQWFSALLSATKDMSRDAADLFLESEASLRGDGNMIQSLGSMNLSDIIRQNSEEIHDIDPRLTSLLSSWSALVSGDQSGLDTSSETCVQIIVASDFLDCGFPALDASFDLVGFYQLVTETKKSPAELCFTPNMFPLPMEMLQELKQTLTKWKEEKHSIIHKLELVDNNFEDSLVRLKSAVLGQVTHTKQNR
ncbi:unnamed protein product [Peronospora belbahrii]|uniref:Thiol oxidase n=1 Tax=Peronospora belbahrii TaxID=622444 RepID=A0ABN8CWC7_9STRA|nr:unnamed protein product [Peronospora belbahrii]